MVAGATVPESHRSRLLKKERKNKMASIYQNVKTAKDLLIAVKINGLSTKTEDIVKVQDIFGHASVDELVDLANDNGRLDVHGNPDPDGTWSSGREGLSKVFYSVLFQIWNWEDATRFYNEHSNPEYKKLKTVKQAFEQTVREKELAEKNFDTAMKNAGILNEKLCEKSKEEMLLKEKIDSQEMEIIRLKARLFDMMTEK